MQLNEAFSRLEKEQQEPQAPEVTSKQQKQTNGKNGRDTMEQSKPSSLGTVVAILLGFVAIGIAGYAGYTAFVLQQNSPVIAQLETTIASHKQQLAGIQADFDTLTQTVATDDALLQQTLSGFADSQAASIQVFNEKLNSALIEVEQSLGTSSQDWLLAEVEYLIRLANQRVMMEADTQGAIALFAAADTIIRDAEGITAFELRQSIANDIASVTTRPTTWLRTDSSEMPIPSRARAATPSPSWIRPRRMCSVPM